MKDIKLEDIEGSFKFRVAGLLKHGDKYLFVKMNQNKFFCLPGGHVELGENTEQAVLREMEEELGFKVKITRFLGEVQNLFDRKENFFIHELGFYYEVEAENESELNTEDYNRIENDKGFMQDLKFKWMTVEEIRQNDIRPEFTLDLIKSTEPQHLIYDYRK